MHTLKLPKMLRTMTRPDENVEASAEAGEKGRR